MATQIFTNISCVAGVSATNRLLRGPELAQLPVVENAYLVVEDGEIAEVGEMGSFKYLPNDVPKGTIVLPAWCDSHTHIVFAASRENEFRDKINGLSYAEIAARGGGILNSVDRLMETTEDQLFITAWARLEEMRKGGTGAVEIKSGYGLSMDGELKMLRVIKRLREKASMPVKSTFLGAHAVPRTFRDNKEKYIDSIVEEMLPVIARDKLADYIDVFCEDGFFSPEEMIRICRAGARYGLKPKLHVNQLSSMGGIEAGIQVNALSLDHLETVTESDIRLLGSYSGASVLLPSAAFFLRMNMPPARRLIEAGAAVTLATDYNPGSSPSGNMNLVLSLACIQMRMLPEEAIHAATINGACAMELQNDYGTIFAGRKANLIFTKPVPSLSYLPYAFGQNHVARVMIHGKFITE